MASKAIHTSNAYMGASTVVFSKDDKGLFVEITTPRLRMRSIEASPEEYARFITLFCNAQVMEKFGNGQPKTMEEVVSLVDKLAKRWRDQDPYSGFAVFKREASSGQDTFMGYAVLGHGDDPGEASFALVESVENWNQGYGSEIAKALVQDYALANVEKGYKLEGYRVTKVTALSRLDNIGSHTVLTRAGMGVIGHKEEYMAMRNQYSLDLTPFLSLSLRIQVIFERFFSCFFQNPIGLLPTFEINWASL